MIYQSKIMFLKKMLNIINLFVFLVDGQLRSMPCLARLWISLLFANQKCTMASRVFWVKLNKKQKKETDIDYFYTVCSSLCDKQSACSAFQWEEGESSCKILLGYPSINLNPGTESVALKPTGT